MSVNREDRRLTASVVIMTGPLPATTARSSSLNGSCSGTAADGSAHRPLGDVLEIAVGTGRNLRYYHDDVRLTGIELSPAMLDLARQEAAALGRTIDLQRGDAHALDFPDERFDTVTCTLSLCTIPDDRAAIREAHRVLRPGGRFVLLEHVRSPIRRVRAGQRLLEPLFLRFEHDHLTRDPLDHLEGAGFEVESVARLKWGIVERVVARKPRHRS